MTRSSSGLIRSDLPRSYRERYMFIIFDARVAGLVPLTAVGLVRLSSRLLLVCLMLLGYAAAAADAGVAVCFGADGHVAIEGAAEHQQPSESPADQEIRADGHGPCIDSTASARTTTSIELAAPTVVNALPVAVRFRLGPATALVSDRDRLQPHAGFGSSLLRI